MYRFVAEEYCICRIGAALLTLNNDLALFDVQALMRIDSNGPIVGKLISDVVFNRRSDMRIKHSMLLSASCLTLLWGISAASAEDAFQAIPDAGRLQWADTGPPFPNTKITVLSGDPSKAGGFVARWRCPDNYKIAPHVHPATESVTVLQGTFHIGRGETYDAAALTPVATGGFMVMPANIAHFAMCKGDMIIEIHASGPWGSKMLDAK